MTRLNSKICLFNLVGKIRREDTGKQFFRKFQLQ